MRKVITGVAIVVSILLTGCSPSNNTITTQSIDYVKPIIKQISILDQATARHNLFIKKQIVKVALSGKNVPYVFSGINKYGWDCSGFTLYVYNKFGIKLEHSANKQGHMKHTTKPVPGDIVAFSFNNGKQYSHVGIYLGHGLMIDANSYNHRTVVEPLTNFSGQTVVFIRVI